jgi:membrane protein DedA with SNARE-associated domain
MSKWRIALVAAVVAIVVVLVATGVPSKLPEPKTVIEDIALALGAWTYALVGLLAFLETGAFVGLVAPGETVVIAGGVVAGQGEIDLLPLIGLVWTCAVLGDTTSFFIGGKLGRGFLERHGPKVRITHDRLRQVDGYFASHGGKTILIGRFIGLVRALAPFIAGSSGLAYGRFIPFSIIGCGLWATVFCVLGYVFWESFDQVTAIAGQAAFAFGVTVAVILGGVWVYRRLRRPEQRRRVVLWLDSLPLTRPLVAAARALPPIGLSFELATSLAVAGVGAYVFVLYTMMLSADPGPTPFDVGSLEMARDLYSESGVDVAKALTTLGSLPAAIVVVLGGGAVLARRGRLNDALALAAGLAIVYAAVHLTKAGVDRDRPSIPLVDTAKSSFPSGHAAYSTAWVVVAVALSRALGLTRRAAVVLGAVGIAAVVGATRIYLRVHYWSDVAGGWALGFAVFGLLASGLLFVSLMRQNASRSRRSAGGRRPLIQR